MAYLLDADWAIQAIARRPAAIVVLNRLAGQRVTVSIATVAEVYEGAFNSSNPDARLVSYRRFFSRYHVLPITDAIAERFADLRSHLRRRGDLIPDFDLLVGATALEHNLTVLTYNRRHFERVPNLRLYRPRER